MKDARMPFQKQATQTLDAIADAVENTLGDAYSVDWEGEILTLEDAQGKQYVLNKHAPTEQLWLSSPVSGAWHFAWKNDTWVSTRGEDTLESILHKELNVKI
jgi:frataxin